MLSWGNDLSYLGLRDAANRLKPQHILTPHFKRFRAQEYTQHEWVELLRRRFGRTTAPATSPNSYFNVFGGEWR